MIIKNFPERSLPTTNCSEIESEFLTTFKTSKVQKSFKNLINFDGFFLRKTNWIFLLSSNVYKEEEKERLMKVQIEWVLSFSRNEQVLPQFFNHRFSPTSRNKSRKSWSLRTLRRRLLTFSKAPCCKTFLFYNRHLQSILDTLKTVCFRAYLF